MKCCVLSIIDVVNLIEYSFFILGVYYDNKLSIHFKPSYVPSRIASSTGISLLFLLGLLCYDERHPFLPLPLPRLSLLPLDTATSLCYDERHPFLPLLLPRLRLRPLIQRRGNRHKSNLYTVLLMYIMLYL